MLLKWQYSPIYRVRVVSIRIPVGFFVEINVLNSKIPMELQGTQNSQNNLDR